VITEIQPILESMKLKGFYISENIEQMILRQAGEK